jgi:uncharacterized membrane protein
MMIGWTMGLEGWLWMGAWAFVLVLVVWLLVREPSHGPTDDAAAILRARFARGEISEDEYRRASAALMDDAAGAAASDIARPGGPRPKSQE